MFILRRFHGKHFDRFNTIVNGLHSHLTGYINLVGSATLPLPDVCTAMALPGSAVRVEGHLGARYFPGTEPLDVAESLSEEGITEIFNLGDEYAVSVQPHSATQANHIVWKACLKPGDVVLGLAVNDGGHISHTLGLPDGVTFIPMPVDSAGINYDELHSTAVTVKPKLFIAGSTSYPLAINYPIISNIARAVNAHLHADIAHTAPYIATKRHPNVIPFADTITIDTGKNLRGPKGGVLVYRRSSLKNIRHIIFPVNQSSPNQSSLLAKACLFEYWRGHKLGEYADALIEAGRTLSSVLKEEGVSVVFGSTDCHIVLLNVDAIGMSGKEAETKLEGVNILTNRNTIPGETRSPWEGSGLRLGVSVLAILKYETGDIKKLGRVIASVLLSKPFDEKIVPSLLSKYHTSSALL